MNYDKKLVKIESHKFFKVTIKIFQNILIKNNIYYLIDFHLKNDLKC